MAKNEELDILIVGGGVAGQRIGTKFFDPEVVGPEVAERMHGHIFDPYPLRDLGRRAYTNLAMEQGRLTTGMSIPVDRPFNIAYIASPTGMHAASLQEINSLPHSPKRIIMEKPVAAGVQEEIALASLIRGREDRIYTNEPYVHSKGLLRMTSIVDDRRSDGNPPVDIRVTSSKDRTRDIAEDGRTGHDSELGPFGVEAPHTIAAAGKLAGVDLGVEHMLPRRNFHFTNIDGNALSEGTYTEFTHNGAIIRVSQGLGSFTMTSEGAMLDRPVGVIREAEVWFARGDRIHLDLRPAVDSTAHPYRQTVLTSYSSFNEMLGQEIIPDYPFRELAQQVLKEINNPRVSQLADIGIVRSLERCVKLSGIAQNVQAISGRPVPSPAP